MSKDLIGGILGLIFIASFFISPALVWAMLAVNLAFLIFIAVKSRR
jgi:hypothetical protein